MKNLITALLLLGFTMVSLESFSQELQDSTNIKKKDYAQQYDYENYLYPFAPEKKNNWALGISGGYHSLIADIRSRGGFVAGLNIQKALGHLIALRLSGSYAASKGLDWRPSENNGTTFYKNYESKIATVALSAVVSLNNINFHKRQPDVIFNLIGGIGLALFQANHDLEDANGNAYNYAGINQATDFGARSGVISQLDALLDGDFESSIVNSNLDPTLGDWQMAAYVNVGAGITYRISRRVDLAFEYLVGWYASDWMDGDENRRDGNPSKSTDLSQNLTVGFNFKLGKGEESLWWSNPLFTPYNDIAELKKKVFTEDLIADADDDGVADIFDEEENTPPNTPVTTKGVTLDSDSDGFPDRLDAEPFTPKGAKVDVTGTAFDGDRDGVPDIYDQELDSPNGALVDAKGFEITEGRSGGLGMIFFDFNSSKVKAEFYPVLFDVAQFMQENPTMSVEVLGNTDNRASQDYNVMLAEKRAQSAVEMLVKTFGIDAGRLEIVAKGKDDPLVPDLPETLSTEFEGGHYLNRRVEFRAK